MHRLTTILIWLLQLLVGLTFVLIGAGKFAADGAWPARFAHWGYPAGFHLIVGACEVLAGLALLAPATATYAAAVLVTLMSGAVLTHLLHGETPRIASPLVFLLLAGLAGWLRRRSAVRLGAVARRDARTTTRV